MMRAMQRDRPGAPFRMDMLRSGRIEGAAVLVS
jgi:hypothetical protein